MDILFYQLPPGGMEKAVLQLCKRSLACGWRIEVRCVTTVQQQHLDQYLWAHPPDDFLPHGCCDGEDAADQPILLVLRPTSTEIIEPTPIRAQNGAQAVICLDGAPAPGSDSCGRVMILFTDGTESHEIARRQWAFFKQTNVNLQYWVQAGGRWVKKIEDSSQSK